VLRLSAKSTRHTNLQTGRGWRATPQFPASSARFLLEDVLQEAPEGPKAIFPADFFTFLVGASPAADADFIDAEAALGDPDRDFELEAEAIFLDWNGLKNLPAESFAARLHVSHVHVGEGVVEGEDPVSDVVPEVEDAVRGGAEEAGSVDVEDVGFGFK
jgi:hypothetical protein